MTSTATPVSSPASDAPSSPKEQFLNAYEREHATTMRVLRAYPSAKAGLRPHHLCKTAKELAWVFAAERGLGTMIFHNAFASGQPSGEGAPAALEAWDDVLAAVEQAHQQFGELVRSTPDAKLLEQVKFFTGPKTLGDYTRLEVAWFLLHDEIHHRGQFSIYLRMADAKVPSIYGPTADEPWM